MIIIVPTNEWVGKKNHFYPLRKKNPRLKGNVRFTTKCSYFEGSVVGN